MALKFLRYRWHKIVAVIFAIFIALVLIISLFINLYWSPILSSKVKEVVLKSSDGLYNVNFSSADLHILRGTIDIYNITFKLDTAVYNRKKKQNLAPNNIVELEVKQLTLSHIHPLKLYFQHKLQIGNVVLIDPVANISYQVNHTRDTVIKDYKTPWQKISKTLKSIHIANIILDNIKLKYSDYSGNKLSISELKEMELTAHDLLIDSTTQKDKSRLLFCREIIAELNDFTGSSSDGLYTYKLNHLKLSTRLSQLNIEGITLQPVKTDEFFAKTFQSKFTLHIGSLQLNHFDYLNYHKYRHFAASSLYINNSRFEIYGNPNRNPTTPVSDRVVTFPNATIYKINADMAIDTVKVQHADFFYTEFNPKSGKPGTISFNNTSGEFLNVTTSAPFLQKNNICAINLSTRFMDQGDLKVKFAFNLTDERKSFSYNGHLGPMNLKVLNSAIRPLTMVKLNGGTLKQFDFDITANRMASHGRTTILYNDLTVSILKKDSMLHNLKANSIESLYANVFILKHNNPDINGGIPRSFYVNYDRKPETNFFKFIWQTLLDGIKPAIGLSKDKQAQTVALVKQMAIDKQDRVIKKQLRLQRRAERQKRRAAKQLNNGG